MISDKDEFSMNEKLSWKVELHNRDDDELLFSLQKLTYPNSGIYSNGELSAKYLQWRYFGNSSIKSRIYVVKSEDRSKIIGMRPISILPIQVQDKVRKCLFLTAVITHPEYRNQGVFTSLVTHSVNIAKKMGADFAFTFPNENSFPIYKKNSKWHVVARIPVYIKIVNFSNILLNRIPGLKISSNRINDTNDTTRLLDAPIQIQQIKNFTGEFDDLWSDVSKSIQVGIPRNSKYLEWRYLQNPVHHYEVFSARNRSGRLQGYIIISSQNRDGFHLGIIVDYLLRPGSEENLQFLIKKAVIEFKKKNVDLILSLKQRNSNINRQFTKNGFIPIPALMKSKRVNFVASIFEPECKGAVLDSGNWYLTWGDTDNV